MVKKKPVKKRSPAKRPAKRRKKREEVVSKPIVVLAAVAALIMVLNQVQISSIQASLTHGTARTSVGSSQEADLSSIDVSTAQSTAQTIAAVFPELKQAKTQEEVMNILFPTGTPEYGEALGVSFDDPINSLSTLARMYRPLKAEVQSKNPEAFQRFVNLASSPKGVSCEFCCGVGPSGVDKSGNLRCGCKHNPAVQTVALYLSAYTDYSDAQILREVMKWKTLFFPRNMIGLGSKIAGGDASVLQNLPGMVGGC